MELRAQLLRDTDVAPDDLDAAWLALHRALGDGRLCCIGLLSLRGNRVTADVLPIDTTPTQAVILVEVDGVLVSVSRTPFVATSPQR